MTTSATGRRIRLVGMTALTAALAFGAVLVAPSAPSASARPNGGHSGSAFSQTEKISRIHLLNGTDNVVVDRRTFTVHVDQTQDLRDRQEIHVSWTGAHPTGGIQPDPNAATASQQEYPVVLMMCRGSSNPNAPARNQITPETCWTQTPGERVQFSNGPIFPPYRLDRYASVSDRAYSVGVPNPYPKDCPPAPSAQHWVPFRGVDGKLYPGGISTPAGLLVCSAGIPAEQAAAAANLQPGNTTYATSNLQGAGSANFVITTNESNASLGCSDTVACSLVVIPIMGISCDPAGDNLPPIDRPPNPGVAQDAYQLCSQTGAYPPGAPATSTLNTEDLAVSGQLWWSASNWRNRITVPLTFALPSNVCSLVSNSAPVDIYGSYLLFQATQQWDPHFCLDKKLFPVQHVQFSDTGAKNLLRVGSIDAAFQGLPPPTPFLGPTVQAPTALTGFAVVFEISSLSGQQYTTLNLDARLLAKLLTESYPSIPDIQLHDPALSNPTTHQPNPLDLAADPEFQALNPGLPTSTLNNISASTMLIPSSDSDMMTALTSYINADPEARAWLNGKPDPWGMVVNPVYKGIKLPVSSWQLNDTFEPSTIYKEDINPCLARVPVPWLPLVASPVENPATITLDMQFDIATSQVVCSDPGALDQKLTAWGREAPSDRFILGLTTLADARRFKLTTAALETQGGSTSDKQFTSSAGRSFVAPTDASLRVAAKLMKPDRTAGSWLLPYAKLPTEAAGRGAYPGTMLVSTDIPTTGTTSSGITSSQAKEYGQFLDFVASAGQHPGVGIGQLPSGFLPITAANGMGQMAAYTKAAAEDVAAQNSDVPSVTNPKPPSTHGGTQAGSSPSPKPGNTGTTGGGGSSSSSGPSSSVNPPSSSGPHSGTGPSSTSHRPSSPNPSTKVLTGRTVALSSTVGGLVFPLVLLLALLAGLATLALWWFDRPKAAG
jgi:hypothetical protein